MSGRRGNLMQGPERSLSLDFFVWRSDGQLHTETAQFRVERIIPISGLAADRDLAPRIILASPNPKAFTTGIRPSR